MNICRGYFEDELTQEPLEGRVSMVRERLSDYAEVLYEEDDANPLGIRVRASTNDSYGALARLFLTPDEMRDLTVWLVRIQADEETAEKVKKKIEK